MHHVQEMKENKPLEMIKLIDSVGVGVSKINSIQFY